MSQTSNQHEEWRPIPGHPMLEASSCGRIKRLERALSVAPRNEKGHPTGNFRSSIPGGIVSQHKHSNGYMVVQVMMGGKRARHLVHRLVATAFVDGYFDGATVDHIDGCRTNNAPENLRWVSRQKNTELQNAHGRGAPRGQKHPVAKLKDENIDEILALRKSGLAYDKIGKKYNVSGSLIHKICSGKRRSWQTGESIVSPA